MGIKTENIALFDLDGTLADYDRQMATDLRAIKAPEEPEYAVHDRTAPSYIGARIDLIKAQPGWWCKLGRLQIGFDILRAAEQLGFQIQILTQGPHHTPAAWMEKVQWCQSQLGPAVKVTITEDKGPVFGKILVDDTPDALLGWLSWHPAGAGIVPAHPSNQGFEHPNVVRYDGTNLEKVKERLRAALG